MKGKFLLLFITFFCLWTSLAAQVHVGVTGGGGLDNMVSLRASVPVEVEISRTLSFQTALTFTQQHTPALLFRLGHKRDYRRATISYVGVPLFVKFRFTIQPFHLYAFVGPQVEYGTALNATYVEDGIFNYQKLEFSQWQISRWNVSASAGIGVEKVIRNNCKIRFELQYLLGLTDIDQRSASAIYTEGRIFNLGFMIPL